MENINPTKSPAQSPTLTDVQHPSDAPSSTALPDPAPELALWELMRKDVNPSVREGDGDDIDRVLSHSRTSIWDLD